METNQLVSFGKNTEDGKNNSKDPIKETLAHDHKQRTECNDRLTINMTETHKKPCLQICLDIVLVGYSLNMNEDTKIKINQVLDWIKNNKIEHLNVAGQENEHLQEFMKNTILFK
ncbi:6266_t:CDS:2 [Gigaspora margarita]|uniref:6266_t:CDS:1 n=1 Tax=Gigaspora margarita TaxID=4874 RepID=A0ABN7V7W7_GIGMA|nr:6266_t:CDS:2 [Gigaspora margarita]